MEIVRNEQNKLMEIWLTNAEKTDRALRESLKPLYKASKRCGYLAVVYESGTEDLETSVRDLLKFNLQKMAREQLAAENKLRHPDACRQKASNHREKLTAPKLLDGTIIDNA